MNSWEDLSEGSVAAKGGPGGLSQGSEVALLLVKDLGAGCHGSSRFLDVNSSDQLAELRILPLYVTLTGSITISQPVADQVIAIAAKLKSKSYRVKRHRIDIGARPRQDAWYCGPGWADSLTLMYASMSHYKSPDLADVR